MLQFGQNLENCRLVKDQLITKGRNFILVQIKNVRRHHLFFCFFFHLIGFAIDRERRKCWSPVFSHFYLPMFPFSFLYFLCLVREGNLNTGLSGKRSYLFRLIDTSVKILNYNIIEIVIEISDFYLREKKKIPYLDLPCQKLPC